MKDIQEITENSGETTGNDGLAEIRHQLDHLDDGLHQLQQLVRDMAADTSRTAAFIRLHEPTLDRALKLFDNPVAKWRAARADVRQGLAPEPAKPCGCGDD
jgi:predicted component of type VI protein secretion system